MSSTDLRASILAARDRPHEDVEVPEWDCTVRVVGLSGADAMDYAEIVAGDGHGMPRDLLGDLLVRTLADPETGELIFSQADIEALAGRSALVLRQLAEVAMRVSGVAGFDEAKND